MSPARNSQNAGAREASRYGAVPALVALALLLSSCNKPAPQSSAAPEQSSTAATAQPSTAASTREPAPAVSEQAATHQHTPGMEMPAPAPHTHAPGTPAHQDHDSKYGGDFFMALDEKHHLEGVLAEPGTFRVYLFDEYTKPLAKAAVAKADAKVTWGRADNSPETPMLPSADGLTLEARAPAKVAFPAELTLRIRFPGAAANSRPELFTFPFKSWTHAPATHKH